VAQAVTRALVLVFVLGCASAPRAESSLRAAVFASDATVPLGHPLCGGWIKPAERIDAPLLLKGVVLEDSGRRCVVAAIDWCVLRTTAFDAFRRKLADAAGVAESRVAVHCVHTHSAPIADARAQEILDGVPGSAPHLDLGFLEGVTTRAADALRAALPRLRPVTHVGYGRAKVEGFASTRRVKGEDGKVRVRYSATKEAALRDAPEGRIDPWLRTVTLFDGEAALVRMHYYASHPQSHYGDGRVHPDVPGWAREYLQGEEGVPQVYFTGCAGDVTAGKYNDGSPDSRQAMSSRLYSGMIRSIAATERAPVSGFDWKVVPLEFGPHPTLTQEKARAELGEKGQKQLHAALALAWYERLRTRPTVELSRLRLGPVDLLHLPGEAFVEYQLYAQEQSPRFVAVASYGEGGPGYICTDAAYAEGGYEPTASLVGPPTEKRLKTALRELVK
jgi:hypothetical protein